MKNEQNRIDRRGFLRKATAAGIGSVFAATGIHAEPNEPNAPKKLVPARLQVPKRKLGKLTQPGEKGPVPVEVSCLSLGTMFNTVDNQTPLRESLRWGVTYWDTAYSYEGGNSELGIGRFLSRNPAIRKELFIATKASDARTIDGIEQKLQESLKRMNTGYIDLYYGVHTLSNPALLTKELKDWAQNAKKRGLIRFFGFSTHSNMAKCLNAAAKLDWIDAIMVLYNWRVMQEKQMQDAIEACYKTGIGLTAMKTQGRGQDKKIETEADKKLTEHFIKRGFTAGQAKIKVILDDKRISSVAVGRGNIPHLREDIAAAMDKTELTLEDKLVFRQVAAETCSGYCAACTNVCSSALPDMPYVGDIMRFLMYHDSYGEKDLARQLFAYLPADVRKRLPDADYSLAEARCPQQMPIARLMALAAEKLA